MQGLTAPPPVACAARITARASVELSLAACASLSVLVAASAPAAAQDAAPELEAGAAAPADAPADRTESADGTAPAETDDADASVETAPVETVRVHVLARRPGVELHVRLGTHVVTTDGIARVADDYTLVCAPAPCDADVPAGVHLFGVSAPEGHALPAYDVDLAAGVTHTLEIDLDDRGGWRTLGALVALIVGIPGFVALLVSLIGPAIDRSRHDAVFIATGASLTAVGIAALPLAAWGDTREVVLVDPEANE